MPRRRRRRFHHHHHHQLPVELYNEIIGYLWNDIPSLKACSLANRIMTMPSQKHLFHCIALRPPLPKLRNQHDIFTNGLCGTSYNFWQLLLRSPHIAKYVKSLHIVDHRAHYKFDLEVPATQRGFAPRRGMVPMASVPVNSVPIAEGPTDEAVDDGLQYMGYKLENGQDVDLDAPLVPMGGFWRDKSRFHRWMPTDKFLPLCASTLCNLKSLTIEHDFRWGELSGRMLITLLNLMQLQSLHYLQFNCPCPDILINRATGENVKHLVLNCYPEKESQALLRLPDPLLAPVYLDSLSIDGCQFLSVVPGCRVQISRLRKLVVRESCMSHHVTTSSLLQGCSTTLEDFEICPSYQFQQDALATTSEEDPIDLSKLVALRRFAVYLKVASNEHATKTHFLWLSKILRAGYSTSVIQRLEELSIRVLYGNDCYPVVIDISHWKDTFDALLEDEFNNLRTLNILVDAYSQSEVDKAIGMLNRSRDIARLRSRRNLVVDIRPYIEVFEFATDVRCETYEWDRWVWEYI